MAYLSVLSPWKWILDILAKNKKMKFFSAIFSPRRGAGSRRRGPSGRLRSVGSSGGGWDVFNWYTVKLIYGDPFPWIIQILNLPLDIPMDNAHIIPTSSAPSIPQCPSIYT